MVATRPIGRIRFALPLSSHRRHFLRRGLLGVFLPTNGREGVIERALPLVELQRKKLLRGIFISSACAHQLSLALNTQQCGFVD